MRTKFEISSGGVVLRRVELKHEALLVGLGEPRIWKLPKGHVEAGEGFEEAAVREVQEETGCCADVVAKLSDVKYSFFQDGTRHEKTVHFYLMRHLSTIAVRNDQEVDETRWFELSDASGVLTFVNEKKMIALAQGILKRTGDAFLGPGGGRRT